MGVWDKDRCGVRGDKVHAQRSRLRARERKKGVCVREGVGVCERVCARESEREGARERVCERERDRRGDRRQGSRPAIPPAARERVREIEGE